MAVGDVFRQTCTRIKWLGLKEMDLTLKSKVSLDLYKWMVEIFQVLKETLT